ncbi:MAG: exodeoxyribonuclease III [Flavobacteriales bacterium]|nr:exodeoxyribonuclease III [Flavobacteriales bacterium]
MKLVSWNVNGIRASIKKGFEESVKKMDPDVLCLQETKAQDDQVQEALANLTGYHIYSNSAVKKGYSGTAIISKQKPISVTSDIGIEEHDQEGRVLAAEFDDFYVVTVYVPNSKRDLSRLDYRTRWDSELLSYIKGLEAKKPVVICGDFNVAHKDVDLARPKPNYDKTAGYTKKEIMGMDNYTGGGLTDTFRFLNPDAVERYSWWSYMGGARGRNVGWRIDYFLASESLNNKLVAGEIHPDYMESDHCPVSLQIDL